MKTTDFIGTMTKLNKPMTPKEIAIELINSYTISYGGNQKWDAKNYSLKVLHILALINSMSYKEYYEIVKELEKL